MSVFDKVSIRAFHRIDIEGCPELSRWMGDLLSVRHDTLSRARAARPRAPHIPAKDTLLHSYLCGDLQPQKTSMHFSKACSDFRG